MLKSATGEEEAWLTHTGCTMRLVHTLARWNGLYLACTCEGEFLSYTKTLNALTRHSSRLHHNMFASADQGILSCLGSCFHCLLAR